MSTAVVRRPMSRKPPPWRYSDAMSRRLTERELREETEAILHALAEGESFVIAGDDGDPIGELTPVESARHMGVQELLDAAAGLPPVDVDSLRADLDRVASQDPEPRG